MQVKRYEVAGINDALIKIKNDLGPDAIIISAKKIRSGKNQAFEVMAALDDGADVSKGAFEEGDAVGNLSQVEKHTDLFTLFRSEFREIKESIRYLQKENTISLELAEMRETMDKFFDLLGMREGKTPDNNNQKIYLHLLGRGFARASACRIVEAVSPQIIAAEKNNEQAVLQIVEDYVARSLPQVNANQEDKRIKVFIGPTGVGKTTTLAKLAARYAIMKKKKVGLITTDHFRIAAVEQLGAYAKIMGLPMEAVSTKEAFQTAIRRLSDKDVILVDTPGRAHPAHDDLNHWEGSLFEGELETNLLINATGSEDNLHDILTKYSPFSFHKLIVTKIDETRSLGGLYDVISQAGMPVTYLTCGQNVPQDIENVTPSTMARFMMRAGVH